RHETGTVDQLATAGRRLVGASARHSRVACAARAFGDSREGGVPGHQRCSGGVGDGGENDANGAVLHDGAARLRPARLLLCSMTCAGFSSRPGTAASALGSASCSISSSRATARTAMAPEVAAGSPWRPLTHSWRSPTPSCTAPRPAGWGGEDSAAIRLRRLSLRVRRPAWRRGQRGDGNRSGLSG
ncbi:unnamed protein product, partial [Urochloa humidicola]